MSMSTYQQKTSKGVLGDRLHGVTVEKNSGSRGFASDPAEGAHNVSQTP